jgi:drug/metabolite transporter (DMT)-like permease
MEAAHVAVFTNLQPVATALLAWAILAEPVGFKLVLGGLLVIAGVWITQRG